MMPHPLKANIKQTNKYQLKIPNIGKDYKHLEPSYTGGGNVKWHTHFGNQCCSFLLS